MVYGLLATTFTASANLPDYCNGYESIINPCGNDLTKPGPSFSPSSNCCFGSYYGFNLAMLSQPLHMHAVCCEKFEV